MIVVSAKTERNCTHKNIVMNKLIRFGFTLLYTHFAWLYDLVATCVSFGEWKTWGTTALQFIPAPRAIQPKVLEIAHGPGHLHFTLYKRGYHPVGIDFSPQMGQMARRRLRQHQITPKLARASALRLPFANASFDCLIATFPTEFISASNTLNEARRVLTPQGVFIIVPSIALTGTDPFATLIHWLYAITGQQSGKVSPQNEATELNFAAKLAHYGFDFAAHQVYTQHACVKVWVLTAI